MILGLQCRPEDTTITLENDGTELCEDTFDEFVGGSNKIPTLMVLSADQVWEENVLSADLVNASASISSLALPAIDSSSTFVPDIPNADPIYVSNLTSDPNQLTVGSMAATTPMASTSVLTCTATVSPVVILADDGSVKPPASAAQPLEQVLSSLNGATVIIQEDIPKGVTHSVEAGGGKKQDNDEVSNPQPSYGTCGKSK